MSINPTKFDLENDNFNQYTVQALKVVTESQLNELPPDLRYKVYRNGLDPNPNNTSKLGFLAKLFLLWRTLRKRWFIVIEDEANGMTPEQFLEYRNITKPGDVSMRDAEDLSNSGAFVLANKELADTFAGINFVSTSNAYNYATKVKNMKSGKTSSYGKEMTYLMKVITNYEANRKKMLLDFGLNMSEWLVLVSLYHGEEMNCAPLYKKIFKHSFNSSSTNIKLAFGTLQQKNLIKKYGTNRDALMQITPLGKLKVNEMASKFIFSV